MRSFVTLSRRTPRAEPLDALPVTPQQRRAAHLAASVLLGYPDDTLRTSTAAVRALLSPLPADVATRLAAFVDVVENTPADVLAAAYVRTFDLRRQCSMYLSYFAAGDTRRRGTALVRFVEAYRAAGWEVAGDELPDHLPVVLEFSARATGDDAVIAAGLLGTHRDGIEVLRSALASADRGERSPWTDVVEAVCLTLGPLDPAMHRRYTELVTAGPPTEMVGVSAHGPLEPYDPTGGGPR
ncbi:nitrate reductase molybdenum cofactor assembly chaperone [Luteimicrobium subarcticum]|uniref:Respiratory nitrate reductase chaperone NarJ n=1 Tax=Luteimicrobium subarcticum TaxID=620910 RepID=A0A2M8WRR1_9MICO|nr:nitrate reductase molybdenum cofactor assembly chaperone [Luteimicrobium subarcticum]PJI93627.1 respiratory nitrate reductase chaperone NarJ [Luteimicrobium subarcticum]